MTKSPEEIFDFGEFRLDAKRKTLRNGNEPVILPPKVFDVLCALVRARGETLSKAEIIEEVWPDSFVEESNLNQNIYNLRKALDAPGEASIIETVPRRGYRITIPIIDGSTATVSPSRSVTVNRRWFFAGLAVVAVLLGAAILLASVISREQTKAPVETVSFRRLTFSGDVVNPVLAPDSKTAAFVRDGAMHLQDISTGGLIRLSVPDHQVFGNLQFSLDGQSIYFRNETRTDVGGDIFQVSRFGGPAQKLIDNSWSGIGLSPSGKQIAFVRFQPDKSRWLLFVRDLESGNERSVMERDSPDSIFRSGFPDWSMDGHRIVIVSQEKPGSAIYVIDTQSGREEKLSTPQFVQIEQTLWEKDGSGIIAVARERDRFFQLWRMPYPSGEPVRITNDLNIYRKISLSNDGRALLAEQNSFYSHIWTASVAEPERQTRITSGNLNRDGNAGIAWHIDGSIVYASRITGNVDLWKVNPAIQRPVQLTKDSGANNENPVVAPDGRIYFTSNRTGKRRIWRIDQDGENPAQITSDEGDTEEDYPAISPDAASLYFIQKSRGGVVLRRMSLDKSEATTITEPGKFSPERSVIASPDGKSIAFGVITDPASELGNMTVGYGLMQLERRSIDLVHLPRETTWLNWRDKTMFFSESGLTESSIRSVESADSKARELLKVSDQRIFRFAFSPDGSNVAMAVGRSDRDAILLSNFK